MTKDLAPIDDRLPVLMKSRIVHWVSPQTHANIQTQLQTQSAHTFMKISELGITINTSEIEGVYTREKYEDVARIKAGMWQCVHRKWHGRKEECDCANEMRRRAKERKEAEERNDMYRELTPEEREHNLKKIKDIRNKMNVRKNS